MEKNLGTVLKELRKKKKLTAKETTDELLSMGYEISEKTISGYETGIRMPNADIFMALCKIYDCKNILEMFSFINADYSIPTDEEWDIIEKYRLITKYSPDGAVVVDTVLDREYAIAEKLREQKEQLEKARKMDMEVAEEIVPFRIISYHQKLASAGNGQVVFDDGAVDRIQIPDIKKYKRVSYAIGVNGKSMEPLYHDGDILLIEPTCQVEIGEIGIFIVDGEAFVKKLGNGELISLNKGHGNIALTEYSNCMGRVVDKLKND